MDFLKLQFLAIIQGLTEFLPVSSSGHLALFKSIFGLKEPGAAGPVLEILLHAGTLISVVVFYRKRIWELLRGLLKRDRDAWHYALTILLSCIPAGLLYALAGDQLEAAFSNPKVICLLLMLTGLILLSLRWQPKRPTPGTSPNFLQAFCIGIAQAFAMLPGVSRSGSTYTAGTWLGVGSGEAFDFSFLMSLHRWRGASQTPALQRVHQWRTDLRPAGGNGAGCRCRLRRAQAPLVSAHRRKILVVRNLLPRRRCIGADCSVVEVKTQTSQNGILLSGKKHHACKLKYHNRHGQ